MTTAKQTQSRWKEIGESLLRNWWVLILLIVIGLGTSRTSYVLIGSIGASDFNEWWEGFWQNFSTEMYGAFLTFILIEIIVGTREKRTAEAEEERRAKGIRSFVDQVSKRTETQIAAFLENQQKQLDEQEKQALINQLSSTVPGFAAEAVRLLRHKGWLEDKDIAAGLRAGGDFHLANLREVVLVGLIKSAPKLSQANLWKADLQGASLGFANLQEANLKRANLAEANLWKANFQGANLAEANLTGANLKGANLKEAYLVDTNLTGAKPERANLKRANLTRANLQGANLWRANLQGANLGYANLAGANLRKANFQGANLAEANLEGATLPDGTKLQGEPLKSNKRVHPSPTGARPSRLGTK